MKLLFDNVPSYLVAGLGVGVLGVVWRLVTFVLNRRTSPPQSVEVFRFSVVWRVALHAFGGAFCVGSFVLPTEGSNALFDSLARVGVFAAGVSLIIFSEVCNQGIEIRMTEECVEIRERRRLSRIAYSDIDEVGVSGTSLFIRTKDGEVHDAVAALSRLNLMIRRIESRVRRARAEMKTPNKSPEPTPTAVTPRATEAKSK